MPARACVVKKIIVFAVTLDVFTVAVPLVSVTFPKVIP